VGYFGGLLGEGAGDDVKLDSRILNGSYCGLTREAISDAR
jgi:hypothetical protein